MNGGTNRGQADGFNMDALNRFGNIKDSEGKSLLDFIVRFMREKFPQHCVRITL